MKLKTKTSFKGTKGVLSIFQVQNKGKGPPGGWVCPRGGHCLEPDIKTAASNGKKINEQKVYHNNQYQFSKFYHN